MSLKGFSYATAQRFAVGNKVFKLKVSLHVGSENAILLAWPVT